MITKSDLFYKYRKKHILELNIYQRQIDEPNEKSDFKTYNSITENKNNIYGLLGEIVFRDLFKIDEHNTVSTKDYDLIFLDKKIDIKSKKTSVIPQPDYIFSIASSSLHQQCDGYVGMRINAEMTKAYLLGYISKRDFMTKGFYGIKGEPEKNSSNNFVYQSDCMNVEILDMDVINVPLLYYIYYMYEIKDDNDVFLSTHWFDMGKQKIRIIYNKLDNKLTVQNSNKINKLDMLCSDAYTYTELLNKII